MGICFAYESNVQMDGTGSQVQRIAAIFSLCKELKLGFKFMPILNIESNPGDGLGNPETRSAFILELNAFLEQRLGSCKHLHTEMRIPQYDDFPTK